MGRLVSVFPAEEQQNVRYRIADNLKATISQRLLPRADGRGRIVAAEVMLVTSTVQELIRDATRTAYFARSARISSANRSVRRSSVHSASTRHRTAASCGMGARARMRA